MMKLGEPTMSAQKPEKKVITISEDNLDADVDQLLSGQDVDKFEFVNATTQEEMHMNALMQEGENSDLEIEGADKVDKKLAEGNRKLVQEQMKKMQEKEDKNILAFRDTVEKAARKWGASQKNIDAVVSEMSQGLRDNGMAALFSMVEIVSEERVNKAVEEIATRDALDNPESQTTN